MFRGPECEVHATASYPHTAFLNGVSQYQLVLGISYAGTTPDIEKVANLCFQSHVPFCLLTGADEQILTPQNAPKELRIISYYNEKDKTGRERGMISMASTLIPCAILYDASGQKSAFAHLTHVGCLKDAKERVEKITEEEWKKFAYSIRQHPIVHIVYDDLEAPLATMLESMLIESGIASVVLHEKKNFSHGRYNLLFMQDFGMIINMANYREESENDTTKNPTKEVCLTYATEYERLLSECLVEACKRRHSIYYEFRGLHKADMTWNFERLCQLPYFVTALGEALDIDISKPLNPIPRVANDLYTYKGEI